MSFATLGGWPVVELALTMPLVGVWHAEATIDADEIPTGLVFLEAPGLTLAGTVSSASDYGGRIKLRVQAGAAALADVVKPRFFRGVTYRQIVTETLREVGEGLDAASPLSATTAAWMRIAGPAAATVALVADVLGLAWGATDSGDVTLFSPTWATLELDEAVVLDSDATTGRVLLGSTDLSARPGLTFDGQRITCVRHVIADAIRTELSTEAP